MKINPTLELCPDLLELRYDEEARKVFAKTAKTIASLLLRDSRCRPRKSSNESLEQFNVSALVLAHLGSVPTRKMRLRPEDIEDVLTLACLATLRFLDKPKQIKPFEQLLQLLAQATPTPVVVADLPAADQVFARKTKFAGVRETFELLRGQGNEIPYLYVHDINKLLLELRSIRRPSSAARKLIAGLDITIGVFRAVMETLANKEGNGSSAKGKKKGEAAPAQNSNVG
jgi:hypothetical protein